MAPHEITLFLRLVVEARKNGRLTHRPRDKNLGTLASIGCTVREMFDSVAALKPEHALCMPRPNKHPDHPDETVCEFGGVLRGKDIYVKVTIVGLEDGAAGCVISFHFPEKPLAYPYR